VSEKRRRVLAEGIVPPEFLYAGLRQTQRWLEVARRHVPPGLEEFYQATFDAWAPRLRGTVPCHLVGLGVGSGIKEGWLQERVAAVRFTPVDVSVDLALLAAHHLRWMVREPPRPVVADLTAFPELSRWLGTFDDGETRLFTAFGLTPNLDPESLDRFLLGSLRPGDRLVVSANLLPPDGLEAIRPQYDNAETRRWLDELATQWGLQDHLGPVTFRAEATDRETALLAEAAWTQDAELDWEDHPVRVRRGERLQVFRTRRYTPDQFRRRLERSGWACRAEAVSRCGQEGLWEVALATDQGSRA
jgi:uncharacterized SAM-dependent methyltransferase